MKRKISVSVMALVFMGMSASAQSLKDLMKKKSGDTTKPATRFLRFSKKLVCPHPTV
jgi:hypothetical protein